MKYKLYYLKIFKLKLLNSKQKMPASTRDVAESTFVKEFVENDMVTDVLGIREFALTSSNVVVYIITKT